MRTHKTGFLPAAALLLGMVTSASATTIDVTPWLAPNVFGSPSYVTAEANAIYALYNGLSSYGAAGPTQFNAQSNVTSAQAVVTGFASWNGQAAPSAPYQNELGTRMLFGLVINGGESQFSISQLSFAATSTDPGNGLAFGFGAGSYNYGAGYQGILKGQDGLLFTSDDTFVTTGLNTQLVDGLVGRGSGNAFAAYCPGCSVAQQQAALDAVVAYPGSDYTFTGTYTLGAATGTGEFAISAVPETSTWVMMILGFAGLGIMAKRRATKSQVAIAAA
jgi:hypothetical protein